MRPYVEIRQGLDALERQIVEPRAHALTMMDGATILALIQRLRTLERVNEAARLDSQLGWEFSPTLIEALNAADSAEKST